MADAGAVGQPWFGGARTLAEQMLGLDPAIAEASGKSVLDLGCAEGAIALEFARAGAASVYGVDYNAAMIDIAKQGEMNIGQFGEVHFNHVDVCDVMRSSRALGVKRDIVLALAILHKLPDPADGVRFCAESARSLIVIRLPARSTGKIRGKHSGVDADIPVILTACGFKRERKEVGPRGEWVQYWRKKE